MKKRVPIFFILIVVCCAFLFGNDYEKLSAKYAKISELLSQLKLQKRIVLDPNFHSERFGVKPFVTELPKSKEEWESNIKVLRELLSYTLGFPESPTFIPKATIISQQKRESKSGKYTLKHFFYNNRSDGTGERVEGYMIIPEGLSLPAPAVLYLHYHGGAYRQGIDEMTNEEAFGPPHNGLGIAPGVFLAKQGYITLGIDAPAFRSRIDHKAGSDLKQNEHHYAKTGWLTGRTMMGKIIYDDMLALSYLRSQKEVDATRIGATGMSLGSHRTTWLAAMDVRVKAAVSVAALTRFQNVISQYRHGWTGFYAYVPHLLEYGIDMETVVGMGIHTKHLIQIGDRDKASPTEGVKTVYNFANNLARIYGMPNNFEGKIIRGVGHWYTAPMWWDMVNWFNKHLK